MKTKTNFATTSDVRNLINATMEAFPKGPVRDGIQTKMFNYWDNLNAGNNLPEGSDRKRFHAEALDNYKAAIRMAVSLGSKRDSSYEFKVTELERKLSKIKVGKNEMAKVEDNFYGKRVVKGIFAKASWSGKSAKLNKYGDYAIVAANADGTAKGFANRTQAQNFSDNNNLGGVKEPMFSGGRMFYVYIKDPSSEEKKTLSRTGFKARFATNDPALANFLRKYEENENSNHHSENILLLAKFVGSSDEITQASMFVNLVKRMRGLPPEVKDEQYALYKRLAAKAKAKYPSTNFARIGFKAKFADDGRAKALVILQQLGGNMFVAMTGAKNLSTESNPPALSMKVGTGAQNKVKHLKVVLDEGSDTYTMIFFDSKGSTIKKLDHVYAEDLRRIFTEVTGFYTSLTRHSRTGVKAKFAFNLNKKVTYLNSDNYPQTYKVTDALFAKLTLRDGNDRKYLEAALKTGEAVKISRKEAIS